MVRPLVHSFDGKLPLLIDAFGHSVAHAYLAIVPDPEMACVFIQLELIIVLEVQAVSVQALACRMVYLCVLFEVCDALKVTGLSVDDNSLETSMGTYFSSECLCKL